MGVIDVALFSLLVASTHGFYLQSGWRSFLRLICTLELFLCAYCPHNCSVLGDTRHVAAAICNIISEMAKKVLNLENMYSNTAKNIYYN
jgi:hypothetical protein